MPLRLLLLLCCTLMIIACSGRSVEVIQGDKFTAMANRMPQELVARNILDSDGDYVAAVGLGDKSYGDILYKNLSPSFLFDHVAKSSAPTFAASLKANEKVDMRAHGFSIVNKNANTYIRYGAKIRRIDVDMIAITDWEGDGQKDWIVACRYVGSVGANPRVFYVAIPVSQTKGRLDGKVVAVYEDLGATGRMYLKESAKPEDAEKKVHHVVPGLKNVTEPPKAGDVQKKPTTHVQIKTL